MNIEQLLKMPTGKENRTGGFDVNVRTARHQRTVDGGKKLQSVILEDDSGQSEADIVMPSPVQKGWKIHITVCWMQPIGTVKYIYVDQFTTETMTADEYYDKKQKEREKGLYQLYDNDYKAPNIPDMCATHIIEGFINGYTANHGEIPECTPERMKIVNEWVAFNVNGRLAETKGGDDNGSSRQLSMLRM